MPQDEIAPVKTSAFLRRAFVLCVICLAVFQFSENTADPDLWGHVLYGEHLLQTGHLMRTDPYSWTAPGHEWINHEILAEAAMALSFRALGGTGLLLLKMTIGLATFFIALSIAARGRNERTKLVAWAFGALAVVEISFGFAARPQIFTALALAIELWILRQIYRDKKAWALALPPLFALWVNTHGGVLAGMIVLVVAGFATTVESFLKRPQQSANKSAIQRPAFNRIGPLLCLFAVPCALALLANPYGPKLARWLVSSVLWLRPQISEWNPTTLDWNHAVFFICVALTVAAFLFSRRQKQLWEIAVLILLGAMAWRSVRNTPLFCVAAMAFVPTHLADALDRFRKNFQRLMELSLQPAGQNILATSLLLASAGSVAATFSLHKERAWTMEVPREQYPAAAVKFIQQHGLHGNLLVFFDWGEMCLWELPESRVSIDGRLDTCYPQNVIAAHWKFYNGESFDQGALDLSRADFALLPSKLAGSLVLARQDGWQPVYFDNLAVVLVKDVRQFPKLTGLRLPVQGDASATEGRAAFPNNPPTVQAKGRAKEKSDAALGGLDAVVLAEDDNLRLPLGRLLFADGGKAHDGEAVASFAEVRGGAVQDNLTRAGFAGDDVGFKPVAVGRVAAQDALVGPQTGSLHQIRRDGQAAFVIHVAVGDGGAVNLRFEQKHLHEPLIITHGAATST